MRLLYLNGELVDIDEQTSIGITYQSYDIKEPGKRKTNVTNSFNIPKTAHNLKILGHADNPQSTSNIIYDEITCDYWIDNNQLIKNGVTRVDSISSRINLYVANKNSIWDLLKVFTWEAFVLEYLVWLRDVKGVTTEQLANDNLSTFLTPFTTATEDLVIPFYYGNLLNFAEPEDDQNITMTYVADQEPTLTTNLGRLIGGGHFCVYTKSVFEFLEYKYSVNFCTQEVGLAGNIWDDSIAPNLYTPIRDYCVVPVVAYDPFIIVGYQIETFYLAYEYTYKPVFSPLVDVKDKQGKTMYDYVMAFLMKLNGIADDIFISKLPAIRISRFDDIKTLATVKDFSDRIQSVESFKPSIDGYAQNNYIKIKSLFPEASEDFFSRNLTCLNKNLEVKADIISIDEYISNYKEIYAGVIPDLSIKESFKTFQFFITDGASSETITLKVKAVYLPDATEVTKTMTANLFLPAHYSLASEYLFLEEIIQKPKVYEIKKWLTLNDIINLELFAQYYIKSLNGSFYINKINGFNPQKSNEPTTIELIRISDKTPTPNFGVTDYFTDDDENFTDGLGNYFY